MEFRTEKDILEESLNYSSEIDFVSFNEDTIAQILSGEYSENQYVLDLSVHSKIMESMENKCKEIYDGIDLITASGEYLDKLGNLLNVTRILAQPSIVKLKISTQLNNNNNINIPAGTEVLLEGLYEGQNIKYVTSEEANLPTGVLSTTVMAESVNYGVQQAIPRGAVIGLKDFPNLKATNENNSTYGRNIEEDDDYRLRIMTWVILNTRGTKECFEAVLDNYKGLDSYKLIPRYNGIGTLKIVCETLEEELTKISDLVNSRCNIISDEEVVCVLSTPQYLSNITIYAHLKEGTLNSRLIDEIRQTIVSQTKSYINGGLNRNGSRIKGLPVGTDFYPAKLTQFLLSQIPECNNIRTDVTGVIEVPDTNIFKIEAVSVEFE